MLTSDRMGGRDRHTAKVYKQGSKDERMNYEDEGKRTKIKAPTTTPVRLV